MKRLAILMLVTLCGIGVASAQQPPSQPTLPPLDPNIPTLVPSDSSAQAPSLPTTLCPNQVQGAFNATKLICEGLQDGEACLGNGIVEASPREGVSDFAFGQPADKTALVNVQSLKLRTLDTENALWAVTSAKNLLSTTNDQSVAVTMIAFGDVTITDDSDIQQPVSGNVRNGTVIADFGLIIRRAPDATGAAIWQLRSGEVVQVTGQLGDKTWYRVVVPNGFGTSGWVYAPYLDVSGDLTTLQFVDVNSVVPTAIPQATIEFRTMQAFTLSSAVTDVSCVDTPNSGVLLQSPDGVSSSVRTRVNGAEIDFNGTIYLQAQANAVLSVIVLEGEAAFNVDGNRSEVVSGQVVNIGVDANLSANSAPIPDLADTSRLSSLPFALLPRPIALAGDIAQALPTEAPIEAATTAPVDTGLPTPVVVAEVAPTSAPIVGSLVSDVAGEVCGAEPITLTEAAAPVGITTTVGGVWAAKAGTTATFDVSGGFFQPAFNNYMRFNAVTGIVAQSADQPTLSITFDKDVSFTATFSSKAGDTLSVTVRCEG